MGHYKIGAHFGTSKKVKRTKWSLPTIIYGAGIT